jgi:hypothetical protein
MKSIGVPGRAAFRAQASLIASYRMAEEGWSVERAEKEMESLAFPLSTDV